MNKYFVAVFLVLLQTTNLYGMQRPAKLYVENEEMLTIAVGELEDAYGNKVPEFRNIPQRIMQDYLALVTLLNGDGSEPNKQLVRNIATRKYTNNETMLHHASILGGIEIAVGLINFGADVNAVDENGNTSLHYAVENRKIEFVKLLIENGADMHAKDLSMGRSPFQLALRRCHDNITRAGFVPIVELMSAVITYRGGEIVHLKSLRPAWQYKKCRLAAMVGANVALKFQQKPCDLTYVDQRKYNEISQFLRILPDMPIRSSL